MIVIHKYIHTYKLRVCPNFTTRESEQEMVHKTSLKENTSHYKAQTMTYIMLKLRNTLCFMNLCFCCIHIIFTCKINVYFKFSRSFLTCFFMLKLNRNLLITYK